MSNSVFVSYSHSQIRWVCDRLVPVLRAGGAEILIDYERFEAGKGLVGQMDGIQDTADVNVLVLTQEYLESDYCIHEMERAIALDPLFENGVVIPLKRSNIDFPVAILRPNPLYVDLTDDQIVDSWDLVLGACGADLGTSAPSWLAALDEVRQMLERHRSVNLVVDSTVAWRELLAEVGRGELADLVVVNLEKPTTTSRRGLVEEMLGALGMRSCVPPEPEDLKELDRFLSGQSFRRLALTHFDLAAHRKEYDVNLFASIRYLVMDSRQLVLLIQSRQPFATLLPLGNPLSEIDLMTVELRARR